MIDYISLFNNDIQLVDFQRKIIDTCIDGLVVVNKDGYIVYCNKSFLEIHKVDMSIMHTHVAEVLDNTRMHTVAQTGIAEHDQYQIINNTLYIVSRLPLIENGECCGAVGFIRFVHVEAIHAIVDRDSSYQKILDSQVDTNASCQVQYTFDDISTVTPENQKLKEAAMQISPTDTTVLLLGESGCGKEILAHSIHNHSLRKGGPFIRLNCSAIHESLIESELFGYEKGSFTGADLRGKKGKFELADKGTIFLDEIGDMSLSAQAKLLRVLQDKEIDRIGGEKPIKIDVRVIAATNRNLEDMVGKKTFREDLFYRLNVIPFHLLPLRETPEEIPYLAQNIWRKLSKSYKIYYKRLSPEAIHVLCLQEWKGNIRELKNILERLIVMVPQHYVTAEDVQRVLHNDDAQTLTNNEATMCSTLTLECLVEQTEKKAVHFALDACSGNRSKAARMLGISRPQLYKKMNKYGIDYPC